MQVTSVSVNDKLEVESSKIHELNGQKEIEDASIIETSLIIDNVSYSNIFSDTNHKSFTKLIQLLFY